MPTKVTTIGKLLKRLMSETGMSAARLAARSGLRESQLSRALADKRIPTLENIGRILRAAGKDWSFLHENFQLPRAKKRE